MNKWRYEKKLAMKKAKDEEMKKWVAENGFGKQKHGVSTYLQNLAEEKKVVARGMNEDQGHN